MGEPLRVFTFDTATLTIDDLSLGDLIDICEIVDCAPEDLGPIMNDPKQGVRRLKAFAAMAWILARRDEPGLTYAEVIAGRIEVTGEDASTGPADPTYGGEPTTPAAHALVS
jgi:hypothetical protein